MNIILRFLKKPIRCLLSNGIKELSSFLGQKNLIILTSALLLICLLMFFGLKKGQAEQSLADFSFEQIAEKLSSVQENSILAFANPNDPEPKVVKKIKVVITAYSSTTWETDDSPYITAAGTLVREGIVANNLFAFGTKIRIPEIYGDKIFVVEDRMHWTKGYYHFDIWFSEYSEAKNFGAKRAYIEILEG